MLYVAADGAHYSMEIDSARVPSDAWGLLGQVYFHGEYEKLLGQLVKHTSDMTAGLQHAGDKITGHAQSFRGDERRR